MPVGLALRSLDIVTCRLQFVEVGSCTLADVARRQADSEKAVEPFATRWRRRSMRYGPPTIFPVVAAVTANVAGVNHGSVRVYWTLGAIAATIGTAIFNGLKERQSGLSASAAVAGVAARTELGTAFARAGEPLITALGEVTAARSPEERRAKIEVLARLTVDIAAARCGREVADRGNVRSVFYQVSKSGDTLERYCFAGRQGNKRPRQQFRRKDSSHDDLAFMIADSDEVLLVDDLDKDPPKEFRDSTTRSYKCFIAVAVRAGSEGYGLLSVDSDKPRSLTDVDRGYLVLLAGILAAGLGCRERMDEVQTSTIVPQQTQSSIDAAAKKDQRGDGGGPVT